MQPGVWDTPGGLGGWFWRRYQLFEFFALLASVSLVVRGFGLTCKVWMYVACMYSFSRNAGLVASSLLS